MFASWREAVTSGRNGVVPAASGWTVGDGLDGASTPSTRRRHRAGRDDDGIVGAVGVGHLHREPGDDG